MLVANISFEDTKPHQNVHQRRPARFNRRTSGQEVVESVDFGVKHSEISLAGGATFAACRSVTNS
jgi:hypothetical protein